MSTFSPPIDASLVLQAAVTKTASFDGNPLDLGKGYAPGGLGKIIAAVVDVTAIDFSSENETYALKLQQSANGSDGWADIGVGLSVGAIGEFVVKGIITGRFLRLVLTAGGTTPSITYSARAGMS